jgi:hypothetical protein
MRKRYRAIFSFALIISFLGIIAPVLAEPDDNAMQTVPVQQTYNENVNYDQLTDYCISEWGLAANPYPAYPGLPTGEKPSYKIFKTMIGDDEYQGISCNTYTETYSNYLPVMKDGVRIGWILDIHQVYNAVWYLGDWGKDNARMNSGFNGTVDVYLYSYNTVTKTYTYYNAEMNLEGYQCFNHQSIHLTIPDSRVSLLGAGYCDVLGNRDKN